MNKKKYFFTPKKQQYYNPVCVCVILSHILGFVFNYNCNVIEQIRFGIGDENFRLEGNWELENSYATTTRPQLY